MIFQGRSCWLASGGGVTPTASVPLPFSPMISRQLILPFADGFFKIKALNAN
jgi:hypothetical protein